MDTSSQAWATHRLYGCHCKSVRNIWLQTFQPWNKHTLLLTDESVNKVQLQRSWIKLVRPLSTVENTRYAHVFHSRQWFLNCNIAATLLWVKRRYIATALHVARFSCRVGLAWASLLENLACRGLCVMCAHRPNPRKFWLWWICMSVHVGYSVWLACISSDKVSDVEDTAVEAGNIDAVVWCSARSLVCLSVCVVFVYGRRWVFSGPQRITFHDLS